MDFKTFWKKSNVALVIKSLLLAAFIVLVIIGGVYIWLKHYTRHGEEIKVPNVCGMYMEEAQITLQSAGLTLQVIDSTYSKKVPLGTVVEQNPVADASAKRGRSVYAIVNARSVRQVPIPDLRDESYRQAEATLRALNLSVSEVIYEVSEYRDLVLDVRKDGKSVEVGTRLPEGSAVTLVVGQGSGAGSVAVPDLSGKTLAEARQELLSMRLILGATLYDAPAEENKEYYIYNQEPASGVWAREGDHVDVYLSEEQDKKVRTTDNNNDDEDFF